MYVQVVAVHARVQPYYGIELHAHRKKVCIFPMLIFSCVGMNFQSLACHIPQYGLISFLLLGHIIFK